MIIYNFHEQRLTSLSSNTEISSDLHVSIGVGGCVLLLHIVHNGRNHFGSTSTSPFGPRKIVPQQISSCLHFDRSMKGSLLAFACGDVRAGYKKAVCVAIVFVSLLTEDWESSPGKNALSKGESKATGGLSINLAVPSISSSFSSSDRASSINGISPPV